MKKFAIVGIIVSAALTGHVQAETAKPTATDMMSYIEYGMTLAATKICESHHYIEDSVDFRNGLIEDAKDEMGSRYNSKHMKDVYDISLKNMNAKVREDSGALEEMCAELIHEFNIMNSEDDDMDF